MTYECRHCLTRKKELSLQYGMRGLGSAVSDIKRKERRKC
jgi:hypothetical protein